MKKVLVLVAILAIIGVPACAQWQVTYTDNFDWTTSTTTADPNVGPAWAKWSKVSTATNAGKFVNIADPSPATGEANNHAYSQIAGTKSAVYKDMRKNNDKNSWYTAGMAKFWVYDPLAGATPTTDTRVGIYSSAGADNIGKILSANITSGSGLTGDANYWRAQWSYDALSIDGASTKVGTGYYFTAGAAAPRQAGWNNVIIGWQFAEDLKSFHADFYINMDPMMPQVNLMLDVTSASGRWANFHDIVGMYMGAYNVASNVQGKVDDVLFAGMTANPDAVQIHDAQAVPEPAGLMALGTGLVGLMGLVRRRK